LASADEAEITCEGTNYNSSWSTSIGVGYGLLGIGFEGNAINSFHNAGAPVLSSIFDHIVQTNSIETGEFYFIERTAESSRVVTMAIGDIVDGELTNVETKVWFLELGEREASLGRISCQLI
jgi:hypothetical protein